MSKNYLDLLHEYESGSKTLELTDIISIPKVSATSRDVANEMMSAIESSNGGKKDYSSYEEVNMPTSADDRFLYVDEENVDTDNDYEDDNVISNFINKCNKKKKKKKKNAESDIFFSVADSEHLTRATAGIPVVNIGYSEASGKIIIEDDAAPVSASVANLIDIEDEYPFSSRDSDTLIRLLEDAYKVIIASRYPSVIMTKNVFELNFGILENINTKKFMFFSLDDYILGYLVNPDSQKRLHGIIEGYHMDFDQIYSFSTNLIAMLINEENCFPYNDDDELKIVIKNRTNVQQFVKLVESDSSTKYAGHNYVGTGVYKLLNVLDYKSFMKYIQDEFFPYGDEENSPYNLDDDTAENTDDDIGGYIANILADEETSDEDDEPSDDAPVKAPATTSEKPVVRPPVTTVISQKPTINKPKTNSDGSYVVPVIRGNNK